MFGLFRRNKATASNQTQTWVTPGGHFSLIANEALKAEHTLIAGYTGCGKSTFLRSILQAMLVKCSPARAKLIIIDPKQTDLIQFAKLPHVLRYADTLDASLSALEYAYDIMKERQRKARQRCEEVYSGAAVYVLIDELNPLMTDKQNLQRRRLNQYYIEQIVSLGRSAGVHLIAATQNPNKATLPANISDNCTCRFGLHCMTQIQSRQIVLVNGCESLPKHGETLAIIDGVLGHYELPYVKMADVLPLIQYWTSNACIA